MTMNEWVVGYIEKSEREGEMDDLIFIPEGR
jgi:hypothetical protein